MSRAYLRGQSDKVVRADILDAVQKTSTWYTNSAPIASEANLSNAVTTAGANEKSDPIEVRWNTVINIFGSVDQACVVSVEQSADNSKWYPTGHNYTASGADNFYIEFIGAARYYRLDYSAIGTTVTATLCSKSG